MGNELIGIVILSIIGFLLGGVFGLCSEAHAWFPAAWYGLFAANGIFVVSICGH